MNRHLGVRRKAEAVRKFQDAEAMGFFAHDASDSFGEGVVARPRFIRGGVEGEVHPWLDGETKGGMPIEDGVCTR